VTLHFQLVNDGCRTENSHMSEVRTSNISPARMIEDLAALPPLTRISYLEEHFKGLQIRIGGEITILQDIGFPFATVGVKNKADGAQVLANFSKPLAVEVKALQKGDHVAIVGIIFNVGGGIIVLDHCELLPQEPDQRVAVKKEWFEKWWGSLSIQTMAAILGGVIAGVVLLYIGWRYFY
jgi:hypothetical protein